jgi:hypothetical protein
MVVKLGMNSATGFAGVRRLPPFASRRSFAVPLLLISLPVKPLCFDASVAGYGFVLPICVLLLVA